MLTADTPPAQPPAIVSPAEPDSRIRLNTVGYSPEAPKQATIAATCGEFRVVRLADGKVIYTGTAGKPHQTPVSDTNETVQVVDFSAVHNAGVYRVEVPGVGNSDTFRVGNDVWNEPYQVVARAMYLWRCGTDVETTWKGVTYRHDACHLEDGYLDFIGGGHARKTATGGWHDAGDYNKYVVNGGVTVGLMLKAWEQFGARIAHVSSGIPESKDGVPDLLNEVRWEVEWLLTMQGEDGRVYHKLSAQDFRYWGPPEKDNSERYFCPWSTAATADFIAMLAETSRDWRPYDTAFSDRCLAAARKSWEFLRAHPDQVNPDQSPFKTGGYAPKDPSHRLWAAAELWETTGESEYLKQFEQRAPAFSFTFTGPNWGDVHELAFGTYLMASRAAERDPALVRTLTEGLLKQARRIVKTSQENEYARPVGVDRPSWNWGGNGTVAGQTYLLHLADRMEPDPAFRATAHQSLSFLFGRNFNSRSYVTGLGARPPEHPHDRRGEPAWPGYLVGGGWPDGRGWEDKMANYRVNEIAINWNGALIYALAAFVEPPAN